jgi:hypothetical protein
MADPLSRHPLLMPILTRSARNRIPEPPPIRLLPPPDMLANEPVVTRIDHSADCPLGLPLPVATQELHAQHQNGSEKGTCEPMSSLPTTINIKEALLSAYGKN